VIKVFILAATLFGIGWAVNHLGIKDMLAPQWVDGQIKGQGVWGIVLFVVVSAGATAVGIPRQIPSFLAGYAFGPLAGTALALLATLIGALVDFQYARSMGRSWAVRRFPKTLEWLDAFLSGKTFAMVLALRLAPFTSNLATNLAGGVSGADVLPFLAASALGYLPQTIAFTLLGCGTIIDPMVNGVMFVALILASSALGIWMWRNRRRDMAVADMAETGDA
jgi:uncharacterized membrane protein YdjX (TVP38/TMEM64 family)